MTKTQLKRINRILTQFTEDNHNVTVSQLYAGDRQLLEEHGLKVTPVKISIYIASISGKKLKEMGNDSNKLIQRICKVFNVPRTTKAEKIATLLAVWNDFLINGIEPTDDMIIDDVITNWTPNKANVSRETWSEFISKIRENNIVPKGYGKHTKRMEELVNGKKL